MAVDMFINMGANIKGETPLCLQVKEILEAYMLDNVKARELNPDGSYTRVAVPDGAPLVNVQEMFLGQVRGQPRPSGHRRRSPGRSVPGSPA